MRLDGLLDAVAIKRIVGDPAVDVTGVVHDSRAVRPGAMFCCIPGEHVDGHNFARAAVDAGAVALLCERELALDDASRPVTQVVVGSTRVAIGPVSAAFWGEPSHAMTVIGVTGTNGKTTTTHLLRSIFEAAGQHAGVVGTLTGARTTPEAPELQAQLAALQNDGAVAVAMEVSSHALDQHRVDGTSFAVAVFTNLSRDHLDFHRTMDEYFEAKKKLFAPERSAAAVVNVDDEWGRLLVDRLTIPWQPYALDLVDDVVIDATSSRCRWEGVELRVPLGGRFNLSNALGAAVAARMVGIDHESIASGVASAGAVPGRFEPIDAGQPFHVIVDYAHTPDGLDAVLTAAREVAAGQRVHVVFGCGGDRDTTKRPLMGGVAARLADRVIVTSDNPRDEDPGAIIDAIMSGIPDLDARRADRSLIVEPDRRTAVAAALAGAAPGDVVVIAGKGHETTQIIGDDVVPFDDRVVARELLEGAS